MKKLYKALLASTAIIISGSLFANEALTAPQTKGNYPNGIAAIVNDRVITLGEIQKEIGPLIPQIQREARSLEDFQQRVDSIGREVLQHLIDRYLMVKAFEKKKGKIPKTYLDNEFEDYLVKNFNGDREKFIQFLTAQGKTLREYRQDQKENTIVSAMRHKMIKSQAEVSPEKIEDYYNAHREQYTQKEGVHLSQITLAPYTSESIELLMQEAEGIITDFTNGTDFATLARKHSQDDMKKSGGDWGWINRQDIREELATVAFSLNKDEVSEPVLLDDHIFILYINDKREKGFIPLNKVHDQIEKILSNQIAQTAQKKWIERLRKKAHIQYYM